MFKDNNSGAVVELVDTTDSKSVATWHGGSIPPSPTLDIFLHHSNYMEVV